MFAVVAACVLSAVALPGQPGYDRAAPLAAVAAARGTTPVAAAAERRLSADSCEDSQTWRHTDGKGKTRTCAWVGGKPLKRCKVKDEAEVSARDACPAACDTCPADGEDGEPSCADSTTWYKGSKKGQECAWVGEKPTKRCEAKSKAKVFARDACPVACDTCPADGEDGEPSCADSATWYKGSKKGQECAWVGEKPTKRCKAKSKAKVLARDACPAACGTCPADGGATTPRPTPEPTPRPTPEPTPRPTPEPTPRPTPELTPAPSYSPTTWSYSYSWDYDYNYGALEGDFTCEDSTTWSVKNRKGKTITCYEVARNPARRCGIDGARDACCAC